VVFQNLDISSFVKSIAENSYLFDDIELINEKIDEYGFISLRGESIQINYELRDRMNAIYNTDFKLIPGALFGGNYENIQKVLSDYLNIFDLYLKTLDLRSRPRKTAKGV
jgi:hypothetical protein